MREPETDPVVRRRMAMTRYARSHNKVQAARHFGCCWATIQTAFQRVEEYDEQATLGYCRTDPAASLVEHLKRQSI
jgi:hypothetical protein